VAKVHDRRDAVNRGEGTFEVQNVWLADAAQEPIVLAFHDDGRPVAPGESLRESFDVANILTSKPNWLGPVIGVVELVAGETFTSGEPEPWMRRAWRSYAEQTAPRDCPMRPRCDLDTPMRATAARCNADTAISQKAAVCRAFHQAADPRVHAMHGSGQPKRLSPHHEIGVATAPTSRAKMVASNMARGFNGAAPASCARRTRLDT
jgi:hypothetical protein